MNNLILRYIGICLTVVSLSGWASAEMSDEEVEKEHRARYYINYAAYLIDVGKYLEALENYEAAEEVTTLPKTKVDARLAKATLLISFLDAPEQALKIYRRLSKDYPESAEIAQYREGMLLFHLERLNATQTKLKSYLKSYPNGRFRFQSEALLKEIANGGPEEVPAVETPTSKPPSGAGTSTPEEIKKIPETPPPPIPIPSAPQVAVLTPKTKEPAIPDAEVTEKADLPPESKNPMPPPLSSAPEPSVGTGAIPTPPETKTSQPEPQHENPENTPASGQQDLPSSPQALPPPDLVQPSAEKIAKSGKKDGKVVVPSVPDSSEPSIPQVAALSPNPSEQRPSGAVPPKVVKTDTQETKPPPTPRPVTPKAALSGKQNPSPAKNNPHPTVRVRMCRTTKQARIQGTRICVEAMGCKDKYVLGLKKGRMTINGSPAEQKVLTFKSESPMTVISGKKKKKVRGILKAHVRKGKLMVINNLDIEDYLLSVVPSENPAGWPSESLKAQAVAARTYAYYQREHRKTWSYDLVDYAGDQAYGGVAKEHKRTTAAVKATAGEILTHKGKPILAMFSANSGGHTADAHAIFNLHKPYLVAQPDPASLKGGMANWTRKFKVAKVIAELGKIKINATGLKAIEAHKRGPSGRIVKVRLVLKNGKTKVLRNRTTLRRALNLPEILHKIELKGDTFVFVGHGWGHGVGYSQWGSAHLGKTKKYKEILAFYYGAAKMEKKW